MFSNLKTITKKVFRPMKAKAEREARLRNKIVTELNITDFKLSTDSENRNPYFSLTINKADYENASGNFNQENLEKPHLKNIVAIVLHNNHQVDLDSGVIISDKEHENGYEVPKLTVQQKDNNNYKNRDTGFPWEEKCEERFSDSSSVSEQQSVRTNYSNDRTDNNSIMSELTTPNRSPQDEELSTYSSLSGGGNHNEEISENLTENRQNINLLQRGFNLIRRVARLNSAQHTDDRTVVTAGTIGSESEISASNRGVQATSEHIQVSMRNLASLLGDELIQQQLALENQNKSTDVNSDNQSVYTSGGDSIASENRDDDTITSLKRVSSGINNLKKKYTKGKKRKAPQPSTRFTI